MSRPSCTSRNSYAGSRVDEVSTRPTARGTTRTTFIRVGSEFTGTASNLSLQSTAHLMAGGVNSIELDLVGPQGVVAVDRIVVTVAVPPFAEDVAARAIEVTQGFERCPGAGRSVCVEQMIAYAGEPLVARKSTVVRLYGEIKANSGAVQGVAAFLYGTNAAGHSLPGSPLCPWLGPRAPWTPGSRCIPATR